jgi:hypothetical protein
VWRQFLPILTTLFRQFRKSVGVRRFLLEKLSYLFVFGWSQAFTKTSDFISGSLRTQLIPPSILPTPPTTIIIHLLVVYFSGFSYHGKVIETWTFFLLMNRNIMKCCKTSSFFQFLLRCCFTLDFFSFDWNTFPFIVYGSDFLLEILEFFGWSWDGLRLLVEMVYRGLFERKINFGGIWK